MRDEDAAARSGDEFDLLGHVLHDAHNKALRTLDGVRLAGHAGGGQGQQGTQRGALVVGVFAAFELVLLAANVHAVHIERTFCVPEGCVHPVNEGGGGVRVTRASVCDSCRRGGRCVHEVALGLAPAHAPAGREALGELLEEGGPGVLRGHVVCAGQLNREGVHAAHREV